MPYFGELISFLVACCWTISAVSFERAGKMMGSLPMNLIRLLIAMLLLGIYTRVLYGRFLPVHMPAEQWIWLSLSGVVGLFLGDMCLFKSYTLIGSRFSQLIMTLAPLVAGFMGWVFLDEKLSVIHMLAIMVTLSGIALAILGKENGSLKLKFPWRGFLYAIGGAVGQSCGLVLSKVGVGSLDPFEATQVRMIAATVCFFALFSVTGRWNSVFSGLKSKTAMLYTTTGSFFGAFLGISFSLLALQYTSVGVAATLMALTPVLIIAPSVWFYHQKVSRSEIWGAILSVAGVSLFFL